VCVCVCVCFSVDRALLTGYKALFSECRAFLTGDRLNIVRTVRFSCCLYCRALLRIQGSFDGVQRFDEDIGLFYQDVMLF